MTTTQNCLLKPKNNSNRVILLIGQRGNLWIVFELASADAAITCWSGSTVKWQCENVVRRFKPFCWDVGYCMAEECNIWNLSAANGRMMECPRCWRLIIWCMTTGLDKEKKIIINNNNSSSIYRPKATLSWRSSSPAWGRFQSDVHGGKRPTGGIRSWILRHIPRSPKKVSHCMPTLLWV